MIDDQNRVLVLTKHNEWPAGRWWLSAQRTYIGIRHDAQFLSGIKIANVEKALYFAGTAFQQGDLVVLAHALERMNVLHRHDDALDGVLKAL